MRRYIPGFNGKYMAEHDGRIWSVPAQAYLTEKPTGRKGQYRAVWLYTPKGKRVKRTVHSLVCSAWKGKRPRGMVVRHRDGISTHNAARNLEWATHSDNCMDKHAHGTMVKGEKHHNCKLSDARVVELREWVQTHGRDFDRASNVFGVSPSHARRIVSGQARTA
jgi:hypothetical protein